MSPGVVCWAAPHSLYILMCQARKIERQSFTAIGALTGLSRRSAYQYVLFVISFVTVPPSVSLITCRLESEWSEALW